MRVFSSRERCCFFLFCGWFFVCFFLPAVFSGYRACCCCFSVVPFSSLFERFSWLNNICLFMKDSPNAS